MTDNTLPKCVIIVPENGEYTGTLLEVTKHFLDEPSERRSITFDGAVVKRLTAALCVVGSIPSGK